MSAAHRCRGPERLRLCIDSHEKVLGRHGVKPDTIQAAARIAAVIKAVATVHATL